MQEKIDQAFEGWIEKSVGDGIGESYVEYLKDNLICSVYSRVNYNKDELMKPAYSDEKDSNKKKETSNELEKISTENSQSFEIHCAEFNKKNPSPLEFSFDLFGEEPFSPIQSPMMKQISSILIVRIFGFGEHQEKL